MANWVFEPLDDSHQRGEFACGKSPLDDFIRSLATQYERRRLGRTFVAVVDSMKRVVGYYTLASSVVECAHLPAKIAKKLPKHPVPVILLGRLAVDKSVQGQGLGGELLMDALRRCLRVATEDLGVFAVEVLAIDDDAKAFYSKYGFISLLDQDKHLFLSMKTIEDELGN